MTRSEWPNFLRPLSACIVLLLLTACGGGSGPQLPMRPDAGDADSGVSGLAIVTPADGTVLTLDDDADGDPSNGVQFTVQVAAGETVSGNVTLVVDDQPSEIAMPVDGIASFPITLPAEVNARFVLTATAEFADGTEASSTINLDLQVATCAISVSPRLPSVGCAIGPGDDSNDEIEGVQVQFEVSANCSDLTVSQNGDVPSSLAISDGIAQYEATVVTGENEIVFTLTDGFSEPVSDTLRFTANARAGTLELNDISETRLNRFLIADGELDSNRVFWTLSGEAIGFDPGAELALNFEPTFSDESLTTTVRADGTFKLELSVANGEFYEGTLNLSGNDRCGADSTSPAVAIRFDASTPSLSINDPIDSTLLTAVLDDDLLRSGIQVPVQIGVLDSRPSTVDYSIGVECAAVGPNPVYTERTIVAADTVLRSALSDEDPENDAAIITFQSSEAGEFLCRPLIKEASNPPITQSVLWRTYFREASLNVLLPSAFPSCIGETPFEIRAVGQNIDGNRPILFYRITPDGGTPGQQQILNGEGANIYAAEVESLPDGRYELSFEGTILNDVPVRFDPASIDIVVNQTAPTVQFVTPNDGLFVDGDAASPGTQVGVQLEVCGAGGQTVSLTSTPVLVEGGQFVEIPSGSECSTVSFPFVNVPLGSVDLTATVQDVCGVSAQATQSAAVDSSAAFAQILSLDTGDRLNAAQDTDAGQDGCQIDVRVETNGLSSDATFAFCTTALQGPADPTCQGLPNALNGECQEVGNGSIEGSSVFRCPVSLSDGDHQVSFAAYEGQNVQSAVVSLTADCSPPVATSILVPEDVDNNGCINSRERVDTNGAAGTGSFTVQVQVEGLEEGTRLNIRKPSNVLFGFGLVTGGAVTVTGSLDESQTNAALSITASDSVGNPLIDAAGDEPTLTIRTDTTVPDLISLNLDSMDCLGIAQDEDETRIGLQFTPQLEVVSSAGEEVTVNVNLDGINFAEGPALISRVGLNQFSLPEGLHTLEATVSDQCGNQGSAFGFEQVNGNDDWNAPMRNDFSIDTVAPIVRLIGLQDGTTYQPEEDADGDSRNGFQVTAAVSVDPLAPLESGQVITVTANGSSASTIPNPLVMGPDASAEQPFNLTLSGGPQALNVSAQDVCGNQSPAQNAITVTLDVEGCPSSFTTFQTSDEILTADSGSVVNGSLQLDVDARVNIFNDGCVGATAQLLLNDNVARSVSVPEGGILNFPDIVLSPGLQNLKLRVIADGLDTVDSQNQEVTVDLQTPSIAFDNPVDGGVILDASFNVRATITEQNVATTRTVTLSIDGQVVDSEIAESVAIYDVSFTNQTLSSGIHTIELCVADEANPAACETITVNVDPAAPGSIADLNATIIDARSTAVSLSFTAPGDDDASGVVAGYEIRRVVKADPNEPVTVDEWNAADASSYVVNDTTASGGTVTISLAGFGPGSTTSAHGPLSEGLVPNQLHTLAIAAIDETTLVPARGEDTRLGAVAEITVDLRWRTETYNIPRSAGDWAPGGLSGLASPISAVGDVDNSGHSDVVVTYWTFQSGLQTAAHLVLGTDDPANSTSAALTFPPDLAYVVASAGGQDVNGDNLTDFVLVGFNGAFTSGTVAVYLGCDLATDCELAQLTTADAVFTLPERLPNGVNLIGNFYQRSSDVAPFADILVGGSSLPGSADTTAWVIAGRSVWANAEIQTGNDLVSDNSNNTNGITTLQTNEAVPGQSAVGFTDLDGDGTTDIAFSGGNPVFQLADGTTVSGGVVNVIEGGTDLGGRLIVDADTALAVPSCMQELEPNSSAGFGQDIEGGVSLDGVAGGDFVVSNLQGRIAVLSQDLAEVDCFTATDQYQFGKDVSLAYDVNGDGHQDLIASNGSVNESPADTETNAYVFYNDGNGQFGIPYNAGDQRRPHMRLDPISFTSGAPNFESGVSGAAGVGDFNGDGLSDLGAVIKQTGSGSLQLVIYY